MLMCKFCDLIKEKREICIVYENEDMMAFLDNDPINEGHILLVPKKHYLDVDELPNELLIEIMDMSKKIVKALKKIYAPNGYSIMQNGGIFNDVGHFHLHIFPRFLNDGFSWCYVENQSLYSQDIADKIAEKIEM